MSINTTTNQEIWAKPTARIAKLFCTASIRGSIHVHGNAVRLTAPMTEHLKATQRIPGLLINGDYPIEVTQHVDAYGHITSMGTITYDLFISNVSTSTQTAFNKLFN